MKQIVPAKPKGFELWRGPSPFDGSPLVAVAIMRSDNEKTGDMIQVYILRTDMAPTEAVQGGFESGNCGDCPLQHKPSGGSGICYVNKLHVNVVHKNWVAANYPRFAREHLRHFRNRTVRLGAYGDPAMLPLRVVLPILNVARGHTGYTHQWRHAFAQDWKPYLMASVESEALLDQARDAGWRCFRVRRDDEVLRPTERVCPASPEGGKRVQCEQCLACDGARTRGLADIAIIVHGRNRVPQMFTSLSVAGRFDRVLQTA